MKSIKLVISQVPLSTNEIKSLMWTDYGKVQLQEISDLWVDDVGAKIVEQRYKIGIFDSFKKAKISIKIFFKTNRNRDYDNYQCKEVIDAIKNNGLIIDDNFDVIGKVDIDITGRDSKKPRTEITIEEITDAKDKTK